MIKLFGGTKVKRIISGGQVGADRGGLEAGIALGLDIGGFCPRGRRAKDGKIPDKYPLTEHSSEAYPPRTEANVRGADLTLVFTRRPPTPGSGLTIGVAIRLRRPVHLVDLDGTDGELIAEIQDVVDGIKPRTINVAGTGVPELETRVRNLLVAALEDII